MLERFLAPGRRESRRMSAFLAAAPALLGLAAVACGGSEQLTGPTPSAADTTIIDVNATDVRQTVDGFGALTLPLVYGGVDRLGPYRPAALRAAYHDVGLSLGLLNTGLVETPDNAPDPWGARANDNDDAQVINPAGFSFPWSDLLREKVLIPALQYGYSDLTLGPLLNVRGALSWLAPIRSADYVRYLDEAAENVLAILNHWRTSYGLTPRLLQLFNEPTTGNNELQSSSTQEVVDLVKRVGQRLRAEGYAEMKFVVPNEASIGRNLTVAQAILADPEARAFVGAIGYHPYPYGSVYASARRILETSGTGAPDPATRQQLEQLRALGAQYGIPVWLTEVTEGPGNTSYPPGAIETVLARAIHIHDNFAYAAASAYFGMLTFWDAVTHAEHFVGRDVPFLSEESGIVLVDVAAGKVYLTGMAYAIGHYARWVRPGALRLAATSSTARIPASAFRDPASGRIVVVAVNNESTDHVLRIRVQGASARGTVTGVASYEAIRWQDLPPSGPDGRGEVFALARARSVITLVIPTG
jgi:O-glycosyl hydrolase